ncbi:unnamed protein product [Musa hybrid cultivar]
MVLSLGHLQHHQPSTAPAISLPSSLSSLPDLSHYQTHMAQHHPQAWSWIDLHHHYQHLYQAEEEESMVERENMFEKPLTPSDVGKLNRLVIPKQHAENQSYVLTKGWSRFVKEKRLDAGDVVLFGRPRFGGDRLFIGCRHRWANESPPPAHAMAVATAAGPRRAVCHPDPCSCPTSTSCFSSVQEDCLLLRAGNPLGTLQHTVSYQATESNDKGFLKLSPFTGDQRDEAVQSEAVAPANSKRFRLFGVDLDYRPAPEPEPSIPISCFLQAEKEQRRLRRVIANRESARQTIRRRQALREELTRKVADLSLENEKMKMEKDIATREYLSLKETNEQLKDQIAKTVRPEADQNINAATTEMESPKTGRRFIGYGRSPIVQFMYPSWPSMWGNTLAFFGQANPSNISGSVPPQNMPSCAWYYPFRRGEHGLGQSYGEADDTERAAVHGTDDKEKHSLLATVGTERANAPEAEARGGVSGSINRDEQILKTPAEETITKGSSHDDKCELQHDKELPEKLQGACTQPPDKLSYATSATAAAEARRRRMELRRLKQCHGGQEDMRC